MLLKGRFAAREFGWTGVNTPQKTCKDMALGTLHRNRPAFLEHPLKCSSHNAPLIFRVLCHRVSARKPEELQFVTSRSFKGERPHYIRAPTVSVPSEQIGSDKKKEPSTARP